MFRKNTSHLQGSLFGIASQLPEAKLEKLRTSKEYDFYRLIFCKIKEEDFAVLYSDACSRPNAPVNALVSSILLMQSNTWTVEQLFDRIDFDLLIRTALGLDTLDQTLFCPATFYNFQNKMLDHFLKTGVNLLESVFDHLTQEQLKILKIKTDIQRSDSFLAMSNIRSYSRIQLLVEVLIRLYRVLSDEDKKHFQETMKPYVNQSSSQYVYALKRSDMPHALETLGQLYHRLHEALKDTYSDVQVFGIFQRVYTEHFTVVEEKVQVKPPEELSSGSLQSPDDVDATYRTKRGESSKGQSINVTETANPDNELNLINDVAVCPNNTDDSDILNQRLDGIKEKTPDLNEMHTDGAYGSEANDQKMEQLDVTHVQTAVRGRKPAVKMEIEQTSEDQYTIRCPNQCVSSQKTAKRYKACFDASICGQCPHSEKCPAKAQKQGRVYYFDRSAYLLCQRNKNIELLPAERRTLRPNVEATVKEFTKSLNHKGKLKVRGLFKTMLYAYGMAISINFGRIHRYLAKNPDLSTLLCSIGGLLCRLIGKDRRYSLIGVRLWPDRRSSARSHINLKQAA
jgi:hypothetical protein